jgi:mannose-1-phosphate guanylyltransferase
MRAILLAAGLGTRLRPLTTTTPKCLVPIKGEPLLGYWLDSLANTGITSILINLHHHAAQVERFIEKRPDRNNITLVFEKELRGTGGTVRENAGFCNNEPVMVIHADNFCTSDLSKFIRAHGDRPSSTEITMMTFRADIPEDCGIVEVNDHGVVYAFHEKVKNPPGDRANGAVYIFEPTVISWILSRDELSIDLSQDVLPEYIGRIYTWPADGAHIDIGTQESLKKANVLGLEELQY